MHKCCLLLWQVPYQPAIISTDNNILRVERRAIPVVGISSARCQGKEAET